MANKYNKKELYRKFKNLGWSDSYQSKSIFNFLMRARKETKGNNVLLDLGAGECRYDFFFDDCFYIAVDFAKGDSRWNWSKLDIIGDISNPTFIKDNSIDFCLCTTTLEHISEPHRFFKEIERILKPGGRLFLEVPYLIDEHQIPYDFFRYTRFGLKYLVKQAGLKLIKIKPSSGPLSTGIHSINHSLSIAVANNIPTRVLVIIFKLSFKYLISRIFAVLDENVKVKSFPKDWILIAEKIKNYAKKKDTSVKYKTKQQAIDSILLCPKCSNNLKSFEDKYVCTKCSSQYSTNNGQVNLINYHPDNN